MADLPKSTKRSSLIPRDISESLGKLPPQALEVEASVLGALIQEPAAIAAVPFLTPDHFYSEQNKEVFSAILRLHSALLPVDMLSVVNILRKEGKIEIVGGAHYIASLTGNIASAANIAHHARIIVEMAIKREMISIASSIHHDGYDDVTDAFGLLEKSLQKLTSLRDKETSDYGLEKMKKVWEHILLKEKPPHRDPILRIDHIPVLTPGNHSMILGKMKSRKTLLLAHLIGLAVSQNLIDISQIQCYDTEQGEEDVWEFCEKVRKMTGKKLNTFMLRGSSHKERLQIIDQTIEHWPVPPRWVILDGVRDLMSNINNEDESNMIITWLQKRTFKQDLHITEVLHMNKTNDNARGHIGTELLNRTEITIEVEKDEKTGYSNVKCAYSRRQPFHPFSFTHGKDGLPELIGEIIGTMAMDDDSQRTNLTLIFEDGPMKYRDLVEAIRVYFKVGINKSQQLVADFQRRGWVVKNGKARHPETVYKLMIDAMNTTTESPDLFGSNGQKDYQPPTEEPPWILDEI